LHDRSSAEKITVEDFFEWPTEEKQKKNQTSIAPAPYGLFPSGQQNPLIGSLSAAESKIVQSTLHQVQNEQDTAPE
jgi:hypothetical protein